MALRYIQRFLDRHGGERLYLRRRGHKPIPLPPRDSPNFLAAYQAALAATERPPAPRQPPKGTIDGLAAAYYQDAAFLNLGESTQVVYRRIIEALRAKHGGRSVVLLGREHVAQMLAKRAETPAAANHLLRTLRSLMGYAVRAGWRVDDPTQGVRRLRERGRGAETWTEEDIAAFEARWPVGTRPRLALALLIYTGQRRSDIVRMGWQHVRSGAIEVTQRKTGTRLEIPIHPDLADVLEPETGRLTFLVTEKGRPFTANGFYMRFRGWCEAAGLPAGRSPHGLRKAAARRMAEGGCTAHQIAAVTGHASLKEVERYTRAADQRHMAEAAVLRLGKPGGGIPIVKPSVKPTRKRLI